MANSLSAFIPQKWAMESLAILEENMVISRLIHRDFENQVASFGETVNTRKPGTFTAKRKTKTDSVTVQDATATNIPIVLNQHFHTSFKIHDEDQSKAFVDLVSFYLRPAVLSLAQAVDRVVSGQAHRFLGVAPYYAGSLGLMSSANASPFMLDARETLNVRKAPVTGRSLILTPNSETEALKTELFISAEKVGDEGTALREASLGKKYGFNIFMAQNQPQVDYRFTGSTTVSANAYAAGTTSVVMATGGVAAAGIAVGSYIKIAGDDYPQLVTAVSTETLTITPGLQKATLASVAVTNYKRHLANGAGDTRISNDYPVGWSKSIYIDGGAAATPPKVGQLVRVGNSTSAIVAADYIYAIIEVEDQGSGAFAITLDRPLEAACVNNAILGFGPAGDYNLAFNRNCMALISRPLALIRPEFGAMSAVASNGQTGLRITMQYNSSEQAILTTVDLLCGIALLDTDQAVVMLG